MVHGRQHGIGRTSGIQIDQTLTIVVAVNAANKVTGVHWHMLREGALRAAGLAG